MKTSPFTSHALTDGDRIAQCLCGDWHTVTFYLDLERRAFLDELIASGAITTPMSYGEINEALNRFRSRFETAL